MPRLSIAVLLLITTFITACQSKYEQKMPADFFL
ncbi:thioredoxin-related protein [Siphonobacter sp. BAB-5404]|nr:thioredoxin-related protein [Siphonobacter sp. SORGH_AS_0500]